MKRGNIEIGHIDIPKEYSEFTQQEKIAVCNKLIDLFLELLENELPPHINRITFLDSILESSLLANEHLEQYEVCEVLFDCRKLLNED